MLGGNEFAARIVRERAGHAFDPAIAALLADKAADIVALDTEARRGTRRSPSSRSRG